MAASWTTQGPQQVTQRVQKQFSDARHVLEHRWTVSDVARVLACFSPGNRVPNEQKSDFMSITTTHEIEEWEGIPGKSAVTRKTCGFFFWRLTNG